MKHDSELTRRLFLHRLGMLSGLGVVVQSAALAATPQDVPGQSSGIQPSEGAKGPAADSTDYTCTDVSGLTEQEIKTREALQYLDKSPHEDKRCDNCQFYVLPEEGQQCGSCQALPGPVHPEGHCLAWVVKT